VKTGGQSNPEAANKFYPGLLRLLQRLAMTTLGNLSGGKSYDFFLAKIYKKAKSLLEE
jgi:hypothetical protein